MVAGCGRRAGSTTLWVLMQLWAVGGCDGVVVEGCKVNTKWVGAATLGCGSNLVGTREGVVTG